MKKIKIINNIIIFYFCILNKYSFSYVIFPFETRNPEVYNTDKNNTLLFRSLQDNNIYINIEMGEPKQLIDVFLRTDTEIMYFSEKNKSDLNYNYTNPIIYDVNSKLENFFDKNMSSTFEMTNKTVSVFNDVGKYSNDIIYYKTDKDNIKLKSSFGLLRTSRGNMPGVIGFKLLKYDMYSAYNIIEQLKSNDTISSYFWMINYTSENEGNLIIGEQLHIIDPKHYKEEDLKVAHTFLYTTITEWGLRFDEITFKNINFRPYHECYFKYESNYILGIDKFEKEMDIYFNESILNGTCFKEKITYPYSPHVFFYCNKEQYKDNVKYFPPLRFEHKELNYTFELNYKDLFIEKDDKIIFMVFFDDYGMDWRFGKPFLKKYSFLMNPDAKTVGFYVKNHYGDENGENDKKNNDNKSNKTILKIVIIVVALIVLLVLGILFGKYLFKIKKPMNVIDDDYDYTAKNDDLNCKNDEDKIN